MTAARQAVTCPATTGPTLEFKIHFRNGDKGRKRLRQGRAPTPQPVDPGRIPRISRLMALAIRFESLIRQGAVRDYADLARLGGVSRARISQIMDLLNLAPGIQEEILFLPRKVGARDSATERGLRVVKAQSDWEEQSKAWLRIHCLCIVHHQFKRGGAR